MSVSVKDTAWADRARSLVGGCPAIVSGQGPLVVLLHGVGLRAEAWNAQIDALNASGFQVVAPDMHGHGVAPVIGAKALLADYSQYVAELLTQPAIVIGHSMGAMVAMGLVEHAPSQILGLAALNAIYRRSPAAGSAVRARAAQLDGRVQQDPSGTLVRWFADTQTPERFACDRWLRDVDPAGYKAAYTVFANEDGPSDALLKSLTCPALFMTGQDEANSTPEMSKAMAQLAPKGQLNVVGGAAHMMPMTHAAEVNTTLIGFARECSQ